MMIVFYKKSRFKRDDNSETSANIHFDYIKKTFDHEKLMAHSSFRQKLFEKSIEARDAGPLLLKAKDLCFIHSRD